MNTRYTLSQVRNNVHGLTGQITHILSLVIVVSIGMQQISMGASPALAAGPEVAVLQQMANDGHGQDALQQVIDAATARGGWAPAPGDQVVYDRFMSRDVRGSVLDYDELPDCANPRFGADEQACIAQFQTLERQVRFGPSLFSTPQDDGSAMPRPAFDDVLSTYIEEAGHSWQEYQYETEERGSGARLRATTLAESERWAPGREYQIKRYILSLDGDLLALSDQQRDALRGSICGGYADPTGRDMPAYGPPDGWPHPQNWPVTAPAPAELDAFCAGM
jgi:hypothetical protein